MPTLLSLMDWSVSSGNGLPCASYSSMPASRRSQSNSTAVASSTRRVASASSGPVPSPGVKVTRCAMVSFFALSRSRSRGRSREGGDAIAARREAGGRGRARRRVARRPPPRRVTGPLATHDVVNQPPPLEGRNLFSDHVALVEGLHREGGGWAHERAVQVGAAWGGEPLRW